MTENSTETAVYGPKQAATWFAIAAPLLSVSMLLDGWVELIVGVLGTLFLITPCAWAAFVVTNWLALVVEGEPFMEVIGGSESEEMEAEQRLIGEKDGVPVIEVAWAIRPRELDTLILRPTLDGTSAFYWRVGETDILASTVNNHALSEGFLEE